MHRFYLIFVLALSGLFLPAHAQNNWVNYTNGETVYDIASEGSIIWAGTSGGLLRIDTITGNRTWFNHSNSPISNNWVRAVAIDNSGRKWLGTHNGLMCFDGVNWTHYTSSNSGLPAPSFPSPFGVFTVVIQCLEFDNAGVLWIGTIDQGLVRYDGTTWTTYSNTANVSYNGINSICFGAAGTIWLGTSYGLSKFNGSTFTNYLNALWINAVAYDNQSNLLWVGTGSAGLRKYDGVTFTTYFQSSSTLPDNRINALSIQSDGTVWIGTEAGLGKMEGGVITNFNYSYYGAIQNASITTILTGPTGEKWLGLKNAVYRFNRSGWSRYRSTNGLPGNNVQCVSADNQGNSWVGTASGLARHNGVSWTSFTTSNSSIPSNSVNALAPDSSGNLWVGTSAGLAKFSGTTWTMFTTADGLASNIVSALATDPAGNVWIGYGTNGGGLQKFDGTTFVTYTPSNSAFPDLFVRDIAIDAAGVVWAATANGAAQQSGNSWISYTTGLPSNNVQDVAIDPTTNNVWFATMGGLAKRSGSAWTAYTTSNSALPTNSITSIMVDPAGDVWAGSGTNGIVRIHGTTWLNYTAANSLLSNNDVRDMAFDYRGAHWFAGNGSAYRLDGNSWKNYFPSNSGLGDNFVHCIAVESNGTKWIGGKWKSACVTSYDGSTWANYSPTVGTEIFDIAIEGTTKWFGGNHGLAKYDNTSWTTFTQANSPLGDDLIHDIFIDQAGNKWLALYGGGLQKFDGASTWVTYNTATSGIPTNLVNTVLVNGHIKWAGTNFGLSRYNDTTWTNYTNANSPLPSGEVIDLAAEQNGDIWIATYNGLARLSSTGVWTDFTANLPYPHCYTIEIDPNGIKWFGTGAGLVRFDGTTWTTYNTSNSGICHNFVTAIVTDLDGRKWIGGADDATSGGGLNHFDPSGSLNSCMLASQMTSTTGSACASTICDGTATVIATGNAPHSYYWMQNGSTLSSITGQCPGTYTVIVYGSNGCTRTDSVVINAPALPVVFAAAANDTICSGTSVIISASGASTYSWQPGNLSGAAVSVAPSVTTTYIVTGTDAYGCTDSDTITIAVKASPAVTAAATATNICAGDSVTLNGNGAVTYSWSGGVTDGVAFSPAASQTYTLTGTATNGCTGTATATINVIPLPIVSISASSVSVCAGESVTLSGSGATSYSWSGTVTDGVAFTPAATQTYTVTGTTAGCPDSTSITITVHALPVVSINLSNVDTLCLLSPAVVLTGETPPGGIYSGPGIGGNTFDPAAAGVGTWAVTYTYTDVNGCTGTAVGSMYVDVCAGEENTLAENTIVIYPNPVRDELYISGTSDAFTVILYNSIGDQICSSVHNGKQATIDMRAFAAGIYYLEIRSENSVLKRPFVKME
jgi:ligand-binding sensor domain-containing protein